MSKSINLFVAALMAFCPQASGQEVMQLPLRELFLLADKQNPDIGVADAKIAVSKQAVSEARNAVLPQVSASLTLSYLGDGTILDRDFGNVMRDPLPHFSNSLGLEIYQPIFTGGAISSGIKAAEKGTKLAVNEREGSVNSVRMAIAANYLELAKHRNLLKVYDENIELTRRLIENMKTKHSEGVVLRNDITRYELRLSSLSFDKIATENAIRICNRNLVTLLGLSPEAEIIPDIEADGAVTAEPQEQSWCESASVNSPTLKSLDLLEDLERLNRKIAHSEYLPKIGIIAGDNFQGPVTFEVPALNKNYNAWFIGVNVKWNISSLFTAPKSTRKHDLEVIRIERSKEAAESDIHRGISEAMTLYYQSLDRLEIERKNLQLAEENYSVVLNRFDNGLALLTDMLDASNARLDAGVHLINAEISTRYYYYQLHYIAGTISTL